MRSARVFVRTSSGFIAAYMCEDIRVTVMQVEIFYKGVK
jgi:hypothetical protein